MNNVCLLVIEDSIEDLAASLEFCTYAFGVAKGIYPEIHALIPVLGSEYDFVLSGEMSIHDIKTP